jgi:alpha-glucosidase (family GH31 glycosyl hydrolase)
MRFRKITYVPFIQGIPSKCHKEISFWSEGEMNYYFIYGPQMEDVVTSYTDLTKPELPPLWALGYHQCKWSYYPKVT